MKGSRVLLSTTTLVSANLEKSCVLICMMTLVSVSLKVPCVLIGNADICFCSLKESCVLPSTIRWFWLFWMWIVIGKADASLVFCVFLSMMSLFKAFLKVFCVFVYSPIMLIFVTAFLKVPWVFFSIVMLVLDFSEGAMSIPQYHDVSFGIFDLWRCHVYSPGTMTFASASLNMLCLHLGRDDVGIGFCGACVLLSRMTLV